MKILIAIVAAGILFAQTKPPENPKPFPEPKISDAQRAKFWKLRFDFQASLAAVQSAQEQQRKAGEALSEFVKTMEPLCGRKHVLSIGNDGELACVAKPEPVPEPKPEVKK
jgi:hypothetical protein